jgi:hypothetical protein
MVMSLGRLSKGVNGFSGLRAGALAATLGLALSAGGCGGVDGVELNGAVFDYLGVSSKSSSAERTPKMDNRPGIVVPPQLDRLPEPGSGQVAAEQAWPTDPDEARVQRASAAEHQHAQFCREALWKAKAAGDPRPVNGPLGPCSQSTLQALTGSNPLDNLQGKQAPKRP